MGPVCNATLTDEKCMWTSKLNITSGYSLVRVIVLTEICTVTTAPIWHGLEFYKLGLFLSAIFAVIATVISLFLIFRHATHYVRPKEQKQLVPIPLCIFFTVCPFLDGFVG
jgi:predicted membrane chloride channel (bestrophin family)